MNSGKSSISLYGSEPDKRQPPTLSKSSGMVVLLAKNSISSLPPKSMFPTEIV
jgi:hypothetical protein